MAVLIFCVPVKYIINELVGRISTLRSKYNSDFPNQIEHRNNYKVNVMRGSQFAISILQNRNIYLVLCMVLASIMTLIPHQPSVNEDNRIIGADTYNYIVTWT